MRRTSGLRALIVGVVGLSVAICDDPTVTPPLDAGTATRTLLTDSPFPYDRVARVDLYVVSVSASLAADTSAAASADFVTLATPNRRINLLALQGGLTDELGVVNIPAGAIKAVRLVIDTDLSSMTLTNGSVLTGSSTARPEPRSRTRHFGSISATPTTPRTPGRRSRRRRATQRACSGSPTSPAAPFSPSRESATSSPPTRPQAPDWAARS